MFITNDRVVCRFRDPETGYVEHTQQVVIRHSSTKFTLANGLKFRQITNSQVIKQGERAVFDVIQATEHNLEKVKNDAEKKYLLKILTSKTLDKVPIEKLKQIHKILSE